MKNFIQTSVIIFFSSLLLNCKQKSLSKNIRIAIINSSLNHEKIDIEVSQENNTLFKMPQIVNFADKKVLLPVGRYVLKVSVTNKSVTRLIPVKIDKNEEYSLTVYYNYNPKFQLAKYYMLNDAIKYGRIRRQDSTLFLKDLEINRTIYKELPRGITFDFVNKKAIKYE
jgi:hypothetical protein